MDHQELFDAIMDSAIILDKAGRVLYWNMGATSLFGYGRKEMIGKSVNHIYDRNYPFPKLIQEISTQRKKWHEETIFITKNGAKGICKSFLSPLFNTEKTHALLLHQNISHFKKFAKESDASYEEIHKKYLNLLNDFNSMGNLLLHTSFLLEQAEKKLRESELHFHLLAKNATDVISRHFPDGTYLYTSPSCINLMGYLPEELIGKNFFKLIYHEDQLKIKKAFKRHRDIHNQKPLIYRIKKKDEEEFRWFESLIRPIIDEPSKKISEVQVASRDITDRILDKKARLRGQQLAHVFRLSTMEEMASGMAHEISQPLAAIVNYTRGCIIHLENNNNDYTVLRNVLEKTANQAERAGEILQRLKNFFCKGQLVKTSCKINQVIRDTLSLIKNELISSKTKVDLDIDKEIPLISIDKIQIQQVLLNLIQNAIEAMQEHTVKNKRVHIQVYLVNNFIEITLCDAGLGFSKELLNKVFMPFFTTKAHGRGMGLAICRSIIEAHGGQFTLQPNNHEQSWIRFSLPLSTS